MIHVKLNKAFTLVELLGVITILGIIALIITPSVDKVIKKQKDKALETQKDQILLGAKNWISDNKDLLPKKEDEVVTITIGDLKQEGYLEYELKNPKTGNCISNDIEIEITKNGKKYDYSMDGKIYDGADTDCGSSTNVPYIYLKGKNPLNINYGEEYKEPGYIAKDLKENDITNKVITEVIKDDLNKKKYEIKYTVTINGITKTKIRTVNVNDIQKPVINGPEYTLLETSIKTFNALEGISVTDNSGEVITPTVLGNVSLGITGTYYLTYVATDSSGNTASFKRDIEIKTNNYPSLYNTLLSNENIHYIENLNSIFSGLNKELKSYIFSGMNPNNWVKVKNNLYRIVSFNNSEIVVQYEKTCTNLSCISHTLNDTYYESLGEYTNSVYFWNQSENKLNNDLKNWYNLLDIDEYTISKKWLLTDLMYNEEIYTTNSTPYGILSSLNYILTYMDFWSSSKPTFISHTFLDTSFNSLNISTYYDDETEPHKYYLVYSYNDGNSFNSVSCNIDNPCPSLYVKPAILLKPSLKVVTGSGIESDPYVFE